MLAEDQILRVGTLLKSLVSVHRKCLVLHLVRRKQALMMLSLLCHMPIQEIIKREKGQVISKIWMLTEAEVKCDGRVEIISAQV